MAKRQPINKKGILPTSQHPGRSSSDDGVPIGPPAASETEVVRVGARLALRGNGQGWLFRS
jgi:hypothetical protein